MFAVNALLHEWAGAGLHTQHALERTTGYTIVRHSTRGKLGQRGKVGVVHVGKLVAVLAIIATCHGHIDLKTLTLHMKRNQAAELFSALNILGHRYTVCITLSQARPKPAYFWRPDGN